MDAVAVSVSSGIARGRASWRDAFLMAAVFGAFQAAMPAIGYAGGALLGRFIADYDHWVAFALLAMVGVQMIRASRAAQGDGKPGANPFAWRTLLILGLATSVDALAVGLSLALVDVPMPLAVAVIGATTFVLCVPAVKMGGRLGAGFTREAEFAAGVVLIAIGANILIEHLSGAA